MHFGETRRERHALIKGKLGEMETIFGREPRTDKLPSATSTLRSVVEYMGMRFGFIRILLLKVRLWLGDLPSTRIRMALNWKWMEL